MLPLSDHEKALEFQRRMEKQLARDSRWERVLALTTLAGLALLLGMFHFAAVDGMFNITGLMDWSVAGRVFIGLVIGVPTLVADWWLYRWFATRYREDRWTRESMNGRD